jgi:2-dehydropantoate 2-reductase
MKVGFLGCGAMGSLFAGNLTKAHDVYVMEVSAPMIAAVKEHGILIDEAVPGHEGPQQCFRPKMITNNPAEIGVCDLVICFVRYMFLANAVKNAAPMIGPNTVVCTLQNGIGNYDEIIKGGVPEEQVCIGTTAHGCTVIDFGHIKHTGMGINNVGTMKASKDKVELVCKILRDGGFEVEAMDNVMEVIWHKVFANVAINALTALLEQQNAFTAENKYARWVADKMVNEAIEVAIASGCKFDHDTEYEHAFDVAVKTGTNRSSMLQDIDHKRETEIKIINGAVSAFGDQYGIETPYNDMMVKLIEAKQSIYLGR